MGKVGPTMVFAIRANLIGGALSLSLAAGCLGGLTGAPALFAGGTEAGGVVSGVDVTALVPGWHFVLDLLSPGFKV